MRQVEQMMLAAGNSNPDVRYTTRSLPRRIHKTSPRAREKGPGSQLLQHALVSDPGPGTLSGVSREKHSTLTGSRERQLYTSPSVLFLLVLGSLWRHAGEDVFGVARWSGSSFRKVHPEGPLRSVTSKVTFAWARPEAI
jgi:hypothetical protein